MRRVVEGLTGSVAKGLFLLGDLGVVEHLFGFENFVFCRLENGVHAAQHAHRQNDVRVLASFKQVAKYIVSNAPDEGNDLVVCGLIHLVSLSLPDCFMHDCCMNVGFVGLGVPTSIAGLPRSFTLASLAVLAESHELGGAAGMKVCAT